ncbi:MAG: hypothetical protein ACRD04_01050 [Terriglobales bacterium]
MSAKTTRKAIPALAMILALGCVAAAQTGGTQSSQPVNGVLIATNFTGADIGAQVNAAEAALPNGCGTVIIPAGTYQFAATIMKPACVTLRGVGSSSTPESGSNMGATLLEWTPAAGVAVAIGSAPTAALSGGGLDDLTLGGSAGSGSEAVALFVGGDPDGTILPAGDYAPGQSISNISITGFGTAIEWGNNAWLEAFYDLAATWNGIGVTVAGDISDSNENNRFFGGDFADDASYALSGTTEPDLQFINTSFDYNSGGNGPTFYNTGLTCTECHIETHYGPIALATETTTIRMVGGIVSYNSFSGTSTDFFELGGINTTLELHGTYFASGHTVTQLVDLTSGSIILDADGVYATNYTRFINPDADITWGSFIRSATLESGSVEQNFYFPEFTRGIQVDGTNGAGSIELYNASASPPSKWLRVNQTGCLDVINSAFSAATMSSCDDGSLSWGGGAAIPSSDDIVKSGADISASGQVTSTHLTGPLGIPQGGTGTTTLSALAMDLAPLLAPPEQPSGTRPTTLPPVTTGSGSLTTTSSTSDTTAIVWSSSGSYTPTSCVFSAANAAAAANIASAYISAMGATIVTLTHAPTTGMDYTFRCTGQISRHPRRVRPNPRATPKRRARTPSGH